MAFYPVALIGFSGCGKTSVGRLAASEAEVPFSDLDDFLSGLSGEGLEDLRERLGENGFRELETLALTRLAACGGIAALNSDCVMPIKSRRILTRGFRVFLLDAPFDVLYERIRGTARRRVLCLCESELRRLYELRRPLYLDLADRVLDAARPIDELAAEVLRDMAYLPVSPF